MRRHGPAAHNQQPHSRAESRRVEPSVLSTSASDPSQQLNGGQQQQEQQLGSSRLSALERVSRDVLVVVLQYLTAPHKLARVSRLSRAFHPLPALAFTRDSIKDTLRASGDVWRFRMAAAGQLSSLSLRVQQTEKLGTFSLLSCPRSLRSLPQLSALQDLDIRLKLSGNADWEVSLQCMLRAALSLPSLRCLRTGLVEVRHLPWKGNMKPYPEADWTDSLMPTAASLRMLTLESVLLSASSIRRLCSSPLESLALDDCCLAPDRSLLIDAEHSESALRELSLDPRVARALLILIVSQAQQLRKLDVLTSEPVLRSGSRLDLSPFMTATGGPRLPQLTEFSFHPQTIGLAEPWEPELESVFAAMSQQLVAAYSQQLTSLRLTVLSTPSCVHWLRLVFGRCRHLLSLTVDVQRWRNAEPEPPLELQAESVCAPAGEGLPGLCELELWSVPLSDAGLLFLLSRCPKLEKCRLSGLAHVTQAGQEAAFRCCPNLRTE